MNTTLEIRSRIEVNGNQVYLRETLQAVLESPEAAQQFAMRLTLDLKCGRASQIAASDYWSLELNEWGYSLVQIKDGNRYSGPQFDLAELSELKSLIEVVDDLNKTEKMKNQKGE